jgi:hypothetical protein
MQANRIGRLAFTFLLTFLVGCRSEPRPDASAAPAGEAPAPSLTPLNSRQGEASPPASLPPDPGARPPEQGLPPGHPPMSDAPPPGMASAGGSIAGVVDVAAEHKGRMTGGALFLIARNAKTRQIVAVRREESLRFPIRFQLSGADAMVQGTAFEGPLDVTVRWSQAGDAMPAPGDIEGTARGVAVGATDLSLKLTDVRK